MTMQPASGASDAVDMGPMVRRVRAPNPSPMTFTGTNSYLVGRGEVAVIDPGPDIDLHLAGLLAALDPGERITHILVTHAHMDHSALAPRLAAATGAPLLAFGGAPKAAVSRQGRGDGIDRGFRPTIPLADGAVVTGRGWSLRAIHTPGHLDDHLCFGWGDLCFSGDHVMGWSTSIVSPPEGRMGAYMASLARLATERWSRFLPGHGDPVEHPAERLAELAAHRRAREDDILRRLAAAGPASAAELARAIYTTTPPDLMPAAERNVLAHLEDLSERRHVRSTERPGCAPRYPVPQPWTGSTPASIFATGRSSDPLL